jgi:hypothetical protein
MDKSIGAETMSWSPSQNYVTVTPQLAAAWSQAFPNDLGLIPGTQVPNAGWVYSWEQQQHTVNLPTPVSNIKSGGGVYYLLPMPLFQRLHRWRDRFLGKKTHRKLHPLI